MHVIYSIQLVSWGEAKAALTAVREAVFIREQGVPSQLEWDGLDDSALHALAEDERSQPIGTARLLENGHIGRMAVLASWRGRGVGTAMLERVLVAARARGVGAARLHAQTHAVEFYRRLGFEVVSGQFLDAGIPHVTMQRDICPDQDARATDGDSGKV